jgi:O-phosphoseryl-tRNA(Cys) synthetase
VIFELPKGMSINPRDLFAPTLSLVRHALMAASHLPDDDPQRGLVRHQVERIHKRLYDTNDFDEAAKIKHLLDWYDNGAVVSDDMVVLSETE